MIAKASKSRRRVTSRHRQQFERMLPSVEKQISHRFRRLKGELREELTAEAVALSYLMFVALVRRGKTDLAYATPLAMYGCRQALAGRQLGSPLNANDVGSRHCTRRRGVRVQRLDRFDPEDGTWKEVLVEDRTANPADIAATRIDFGTWMNSLSKRKRRIAMALAGGERPGRVARMFHLTAGRISQIRRELHDAWLEFQGEAVAATA